MGRPNNFREELRLREITRKKISKVEKLETEIKEVKTLKIEAIELKSFKLLGDLNMEKRFEIEKINEIEIKLERLKIPKKMLIQLKQ